MTNPDKASDPDQPRDPTTLQSCELPPGAVPAAMASLGSHTQPPSDPGPAPQTITSSASMPAAPAPGDQIPSPAPPVDVAAVMAEIRAAVAEKRRLGIYPPAGDTAAPPVGTAPATYGANLPADRHIQALATTARLDIEGEPIRSHRPFLGAPIKAFKKFTRFWIRRYTDTIFLRQTHFNSETAAATAALHRELTELRREVEQLRAKVQELQKHD